MKKHLYFSLMLLVTFGCFLVGNDAYAQTVVDENGFEGTVLTGDKVKLTKYPESAFVTIPDKIDEYQVTEIGSSCFYYDSKLESVEIPGICYNNS